MFQVDEQILEKEIHRANGTGQQRVTETEPGETDPGQTAC
jgi:hypothetical protein